MGLIMTYISNQNVKRINVDLVFSVKFCLFLRNFPNELFSGSEVLHLVKAQCQKGWVYDCVAESHRLSAHPIFLQSKAAGM